MYAYNRSRTKDRNGWRKDRDWSTKVNEVELSYENYDSTFKNICLLQPLNNVMYEIMRLEYYVIEIYSLVHISFEW